MRWLQLLSRFVHNRHSDLPKFITAVEVLEPEFKGRQSNLNQPPKMINCITSLGKSKDEEGRVAPIRCLCIPA